MITFHSNQYADLTEISCKAPAPLCPDETHLVAVITHIPGSKWHVRLAREWTSRPMASLKTRRAAEAFVLANA